MGLRVARVMHNSLVDMFIALLHLMGVGPFYIEPLDLGEGKEVPLMV